LSILNGNDSRVRILTRYLIRLHLAPFLFSLTAVTLLMLLDQVSKRFVRLVGKGLPWTVIAEVFVLSVPFLVAMTLPMSVLVAVLYSFNRLASDNEITAMKAGGISLPRLVIPLVIVATLLAGGLVWFNNTVLPESNHRLSILLHEIGRKKPTFALDRERSIIEVLPSELFMEAARIDRTRNALQEVTVYDERGGGRSRTIYADSGLVAFAEDQTTLVLVLYDGRMGERRSDEPESFQSVTFSEFTMKVPGVSNRLERGRIGGYRGDREMSIGQMREEVRIAKRLLDEAREESRGLAVGITLRALGEDVTPTESATTDTVAAEAGVAGGKPALAGEEPGEARERSRAEEPSADAAIDPGERLGARRRGAGAREPAIATEGPAGGASIDTTGVVVAGVPTDTTGMEAAGASPDTIGTAEAAGAAADTTSFSRGLSMAETVGSPFEAANRLKSLATRERSALETASRFSVEIQKKFSIPFVCIVFVLIGAPIAVRYPRGGVSMVVGVSLAFFCAYYVALIGGEELADRLIVTPFWAMWAPNVLFGVLGVLMLWRTVRGP
jgi:lipopolysaccharide export system permease protein